MVMVILIYMVLLLRRFSMDSIYVVRNIYSLDVVGGSFSDYESAHYFISQLPYFYDYEVYDIIYCCVVGN